MVWRQLDIYGVPRNRRNYPLSVLERMVTTEIQVYMHLRDLWGTLVPHFKYFGYDWSMLWVFVTTYEGISLSTIVKNKGGLTFVMKSKAMESLQQLHDHGVVHGDAEMSNVLWRERDQRAIWVDFELSQIGGDNFNSLIQTELVHFQKELDLVDTIQETEIRFADMPLVKKKKSPA